jgi:DNA (cytosine-5)-methyltransferase 1
MRGKKNNIIKYSNIRETLKINPLRDDDNTQAYITHYLQNRESEAGIVFRDVTIPYLKNLKTEESNEYLLDLEWDVPYKPIKNSKFTFIDLFAGIGGIRLAYQNAGGKCVFSSEWNKFSKITYEVNFGEVPFGDITKIDEKTVPDHDILLGGFPCQPFSIAGVSKKNSLGREHGFLDETQGTLFFDIARIIKHKKPKAFMLENVKNLLSHDKGKTFKVIHKTLSELGYSLHYKVLDGKYYVPQHRERIILVGFNKSIYHGCEEFTFPTYPNKNYTILNILESTPDKKYTLSDKLWNYLQEYALKHKSRGNGFGYGLTDLNGISRTLSARYYKDGSEILIPQKNINPRRLTPRECARIMGFPDSFIIPVSDNQAYKQFGNAVIVPLIESVAFQIKKVIANEYNSRIGD